MIAPKALEAFVTGKFGLSIPKEILLNMEAERENQEVYNIEACMEFNQEAKVGESIIRIKIELEEVRDQEATR